MEGQGSGEGRARPVAAGEEAAGCSAPVTTGAGQPRSPSHVAACNMTHAVTHAEHDKTMLKHSMHMQTCSPSNELASPLASSHADLQSHAMSHVSPSSHSVLATLHKSESQSRVTESQTVAAEPQSVVTELLPAAAEPQPVTVGQQSQTAKRALPESAAESQKAARLLEPHTSRSQSPVLPSRQLGTDLNEKPPPSLLHLTSGKSLYKKAASKKVGGGAHRAVLRDGAPPSPPPPSVGGLVDRDRPPQTPHSSVGLPRIKDRARAGLSSYGVSELNSAAQRASGSRESSGSVEELSSRELPPPVESAPHVHLVGPPPSHHSPGSSPRRRCNLGVGSPGSASLRHTSVPSTPSQANHALSRVNDPLPPSLLEFDSDSESEGGSIPDPEDDTELNTSESESESEEPSHDGRQEPARPRPRPEPVLPADPSDPCQGPDPLSASVQERLERLFGNLGSVESERIRPTEPEWLPDKSVTEWAELIWQSVPAALRWWVEVIEGYTPLSDGQQCLPRLRKLLDGKADKYRFEYIRLLFVSQKCPSEHRWFIESRESVFAAFPSETFGRSEYKWDSTTAPIERVLSVVDCFVTLCEEEPVPHMLDWNPITRVVEPRDFAAGGVHEPEIVKRWEQMPGCAKRVLSWIQKKVFIKPVKKVKKIRKRNAKCLRKEDEGNLQFDQDKFEFVDKKVKEDRAAGVVHRLGPDNPPHATCPLNAVPKPGGGKDKFRVIGNMKQLNKYFPGWKMRFEDLRHFHTIFSEDDFIFNLDLKAAYHTVLAHPWLARLFGFHWDGVYWHWTCLPFGFRLSPFVFCRVVKQVVKVWRRAGLAVLSYVDDQAGGAKGFVASVRARNRMLRDNTWYGFTMAPKSVPLPMQRVVFLGLVQHLACPVPKFHVPTAKVEALRELAAESVTSLASEATCAAVEAGERRIVDVCCGDCSIPIAQWKLHPKSTWILAYDILADDMSEDGFWIGIPEEVRPFVTYVKLDVLKLTLKRLEADVRKAWGCGLSGVAYLHWSHMCDTLSRASRRGKTKGIHRHEDHTPKSEMAKDHDRRFHLFLGVLREFVKVAPLACVSLENPFSEAFLAFQDLHELASEPGWRLVEHADHCMLANHLDHEDGKVFPQKPSSWLLYGVPAGVVFPTCHRSCKFRIHEGSKLHRKLVCPHSKMHPKQSVIPTKREKSHIPFGASVFIFEHHMQWMRGAEAARLAKDTRLVPMRKVAKVVGRLVSMGFAIGPSRLMSRNLVRAMYSNEQVDWDAWVAVDPAAVAELVWITKLLAEWNDRGIPIWRKQQVVDLVLTQDASPTGVGFRVETGSQATVLERHVPFSWQEAGLAHVHREMLGLVVAVMVAVKLLEDRAVQIRVDSMSTVKYVRDRGGQSEVMNFLTRMLWGWFIRHRISVVKVCHIAGVIMVDNGVDGLSRPTPPKALSEADRYEWQLAPEAWQWVKRELASRGIVVSCDRFATRANRVCSRFCSLQLEPGALSPPDCFTHNWAEEAGWNWAFPPLRDIGRILGLVRQQGARAVVLVPDWRMHWHSNAVSMAKEVIPLTGPGPFFRRLRDGEWQTVQKFVFRPKLLVLDESR